MGKLADRIADAVASYVDAAIKRIPTMTAVGTVVTSPSQVSTDPLMVIVDGSALAVPVKQLRGFPLVAGSRVVLVKFGSDWAVVGSLTNPGIGTNTSRMVIGADTPAELKAYGIDVAILSYITHKDTGIEVGYFFIGTTNRLDGFGDSRAQVFGNVTYPTPGDPSTATVSNVKTNFQQDMWGQYPDTIFKDHRIRIWTDVNLEPSNGMNSFQLSGRNIQWTYAEGEGQCNAATNANAVAADIPGTLVTLANLSATNDYAVCTGVVDFQQFFASNTVAVVFLMVNGVAQSRQVVFSGQVANARGTFSQKWRVPLTAVSAANTFQLRVQKAVGTDAHIQVQAQHTALYVELKEDI